MRRSHFIRTVPAKDEPASTQDTCSAYAPDFQTSQNRAQTPHFKDTTLLANASTGQAFRQCQLCRGISISLLHNRRPKGANANQHWSFLAGALQPRVLLLYHDAPVSIAGLCIIPACSICFESSCLFPILQLSKNIFFMFIITLNPSLFMPVVVSLHDSSQCLKLISTLYPAQETQTVSNLSTCF